MATDTDQTSETSTATSEAVSESVPQSDSAPDSSETIQSAADGDGDSEVSEAPPKPAYTPNYKLKVYDEEKELDDPFLKALIKDADSEKKVKEIAQKALGFDTVKTRHEKTKQDFQEYQKNAQPVVEYYNQADKLLRTGDLQGFFEMVNIPDDAIFKYAIQKAEMTPEQRAYTEQQRAFSRQQDQLKSQNQTLMTQQQEQAASFRNQELSWVLARPDIAQTSNTYDQKVGRPGAFRQLVIEKGIAHAVATQGREDLSPEQATQEVLKYIGALLTPTMSPGVTAPQTQQLIQQNGQPPIIPNVSGRASSPVKKQIKSTDDLRKRREELMGSSS